MVFTTDDMFPIKNSYTIDHGSNRKPQSNNNIDNEDTVVNKKPGKKNVILKSYVPLNTKENETQNPENGPISQFNVKIHNLAYNPSVLNKEPLLNGNCDEYPQRGELNVISFIPKDGEQSIPYDGTTDKHELNKKNKQPVSPLQKNDNPNLHNNTILPNDSLLNSVEGSNLLYEKLRKLSTENYKDDIILHDDLTINSVQSHNHTSVDVHKPVNHESNSLIKQSIDEDTITRNKRLRHQFFNEEPAITTEEKHPIHTNEKLKTIPKELHNAKGTESIAVIKNVDDQIFKTENHVVQPLLTTFTGDRDSKVNKIKHVGDVPERYSEPIPSTSRANHNLKEDETSFIDETFFASESIKYNVLNQDDDYEMNYKVIHESGNETNNENDEGSEIHKIQSYFYIMETFALIFLLISGSILILEFFKPQFLLSGKLYINLFYGYFLTLLCFIVLNEILVASKNVRFPWLARVLFFLSLFLIAVPFYMKTKLFITN